MMGSRFPMDSISMSMTEKFVIGDNEVTIL